MFFDNVYSQRKEKDLVLLIWFQRIFIIMLLIIFLIFNCFITVQSIHINSFFNNKFLRHFSTRNNKLIYASPIAQSNLSILSVGEEISQVATARKTSKKLYDLLINYEDSYYDDENMVLGTDVITKNTYTRQPYVANGYIGSRIPNIGFGYALDEYSIWNPDVTDNPELFNNGWPLRNRRYAGSFVSDFYSLQKKLNSTNFPEIDDIGYSNVISSIPEWTNIKLTVIDENDRSFNFNPQDISVNDITNYHQNLSMQNGMVTTDLNWLNNTLHINSTMFTHRKLYPLGLLEIDITLNREYLPTDFATYNISVFDILDFNTSHRTFLRDMGPSYDSSKMQGIFMVVEPENVPYTNCVIFSTTEIEQLDITGSVHRNITLDDYVIDGMNSSISQVAKDITLSTEFPKLKIYKYSSIISSNYDGCKNNTYQDNLNEAKHLALNSRGNFQNLADSNTQAWVDLYDNAFIEIPSDSVLELAARSSLFHLMSNARLHNISEDRGLPLPVSGLSSDSYGGLVFWDADVWMQPAILPFFPDVAKNINNYRNATHKQAQLNAKQYGYNGAWYPWTSGGFSNCTSTGPCIDYEYHINVDIALATFSIYMNGADGIDDTYLKYTVWPIVRDAAIAFTEYVQYDKQLDVYETFNLTDPDEFANHVNNGAFTNAGIKILMKWAVDIGNHLEEKVDPIWKAINEKIVIPKTSSNITLEYSGMNSTAEIKQADVPLLVYPLGYITDESILNNAIRDLYYYSEHQAHTGPAMTYPVFVAAAAGLLNHGSSSQSYLYKSILPYLRGPFAQFSEQSDDNFLENGGLHPAYPFLTANGGFLQSILFGLTGIRYSYKVDSDTNKIARLLKFNPIKLKLLPGGLKIRNFKYMGQVLDIIIDDYNGTIIHKSGNKTITIQIPDRSSIRDQDINPYRGKNKTKEDNRILSKRKSNIYELKPNENFTIPLFVTELNAPGNIVESKQITNLTEGVAGDVAMSAVDGNNYTHWQPVNKAETARLLIDLGPGNEQTITGGMFLWGQRPAKNVSISVLPHSQATEQLFQNITYFAEHFEFPNRERTILQLIQEVDNITEPEVCQIFSSDGVCDAGFTQLLNWKSKDIDELIQQFPNTPGIRENFITIVDNLSVLPSEPYYPEYYEQALIEILPSNKTKFSVDYSKVEYYKKSEVFEQSQWPKTRFIIVSIQDTYDKDLDPKGSTIKEIILYS
ncbi:hypothetical protein TPHA_0E00650 [Tetrapisispora phaffii CBS 4417]|uniref:alpha,alpha-trehalase n=1 Tax=Tetrapisispora phaffii (strain ATCC 24235 / CBS 4417 / NBRC 1672 / NRRL Y-8282 / UCD 70-5) TaxID=1071381 RepID=G8BTD2_TETPH|nr:hypothetical protein TPHA_0E00650 [Tetrapisispora phaffii CBS 4417]CCE63160.1 hypothetical protein TPHA_0E00650 [Tetrapisispora phaffii CBS 4417]